MKFLIVSFVPVVLEGNNPFYESPNEDIYEGISAISCITVPVIHRVMRPINYTERKKPHFEHVISFGIPWLITIPRVSSVSKLRSSMYSRVKEYFAEGSGTTEEDLLRSVALKVQRRSGEVEDMEYEECLRLDEGCTVILEWDLKIYKKSFNPSKFEAKEEKSKFSTEKDPPLSLYDSLDLFTSKETLDEKNEWYCSSTIFST
jgi:hypothetical protein